MVDGKTMAVHVEVQRLYRTVRVDDRGPIARLLNAAPPDPGLHDASAFVALRVRRHDGSMMVVGVEHLCGRVGSPEAATTDGSYVRRVGEVRAGQPFEVAIEGMSPDVVCEVVVSLSDVGPGDAL